MGMGRINRNIFGQIFEFLIVTQVLSNNKDEISFYIYGSPAF
jgi:hypothetical protein